jgi:hypothetical protein
MAESDPRFRTLHALRIKGFAKSDVIAEIAALPVPDVEEHLNALKDCEHALFREARGLWQLTPAGKEAHLEALAEDSPPTVRAEIHEHYGGFLDINVGFKALCGDWQLVDGHAETPNDHSNPEYDAGVVARLVELDADAKPIIDKMAGCLPRLAPYNPRLSTALSKLQAGETKMFTGVMCNSYHDVWMELHEDLILTLGVDRAAEGSF